MTGMHGPLCRTGQGWKCEAVRGAASAVPQSPSVSLPLASPCSSTPPAPLPRPPHSYVQLLLQLVNSTLDHVRCEQGRLLHARLHQGSQLAQGGRDPHARQRGQRPNGLDRGLLRWGAGRRGGGVAAMMVDPV